MPKKYLLKVAHKIRYQKCKLIRFISFTHNTLKKGTKAKDIEGVARWVNLKEIKDNDYNLNIARYVQKTVRRRKRSP